MSGLDALNSPQLGLSATDRSLGALERVRSNARSGRTEEAAKQFESFLARTLVSEMRRGLSEGFFQGAGSDTYNAWLDEHLGETLTRTDALGLSGMVKAAVGQLAEAAE